MTIDKLISLLCDAKCEGEYSILIGKHSTVYLNDGRTFKIKVYDFDEQTTEG